MATAYEEAVGQLYRAPRDAFVDERKRFAAELRARGDREGAARLAKLPRPTISAWVVNQLWCQAGPMFEQLLSTAERLRGGDLQATAAHREAMVALRTLAGALLRDAGHASADLTMRKVATNLAAIAAKGGFDPDLSGALSADREPPGFEAMDLAAVADQKPMEVRPAAGNVRQLSDARSAASRRESEQRLVEMQKKRAEEEI